ncbi:MAG: hypothetical protein ABJP82_01020 [Hyphomicrobiales bacterium]
MATASHLISFELDALEAIAAMVEKRIGQTIDPEWLGLRDQHSSVQVLRVSGVTSDGARSCFLTIILELSVKSLTSQQMF